MGIFAKVPPGAQPPSKGTSAPQNTAVGSGSMPTKSKFPLESSAPADAKNIRDGKTYPNI